MKTLLLIDGNAIMHRAFHALPPLTTASGIPTNMIYGFFTMLGKVITDFHPDYIAICFDTPKPTFRQELLKDYQAQRPAMADEFKTQIPYVRQILDAGGIRRMEKDGYEADDIIGSLATKFKSDEIRVYILTGDKDIMQLVDKSVSVIAPKTGLSTIMLYTPQEVQNKLGVSPSQIPDYKALAGDPSDNYKGVKGIGPKTAARLICEYHSVENLLDTLDTVPDVKLRDKLKSNRDIIMLNKKIATIITDLDLKLTLDQYLFKSYKPEMKDLLKELQFFSLLKRISPEPLSEKPKKEPEAKKDDSQPGLF